MPLFYYDDGYPAVYARVSLLRRYWIKEQTHCALTEEGSGVLVRVQTHIRR